MSGMMRMKIGRYLLAMLAVCMTGLAPVHATEQVTIYLTDALGTPVVEMNGQGEVINRSQYRPYGKQTQGSGEAGPGFTGHVNDPDTGLVYMQARYYDPVSGRFLSTDPMTTSAGGLYGFNRYAYANDNPIVNIDPNGTTCTRSDSKNSYSCQIDRVRTREKGEIITRPAIAADHKKYKAVESSLTKAVNSAAKSGKTENITFKMGGKMYSFSISGSGVAKSLVKRIIVINPLNKGAMGTVGNTTIVGGQGINPGRTIYGNADRTRSMEFMHEGLHNTSQEMSALGKVGSIFMGTHQDAHQKSYNQAASDLLWPIP